MSRFYSKKLPNQFNNNRGLEHISLELKDRINKPNRKLLVMPNMLLNLVSVIVAKHNFDSLNGAILASAPQNYHINIDFNTKKLYII